MTGIGRSENMRRIRSRDTQPELLVRRLVYGLGYRYRLHRKDLPGKPDLAFIGQRKIIFVHGCFWHQHPDPSCSDARLPKSHTGYWRPKLERNTRRDTEHVRALQAAGWQVLVIWDCDLRDEAQLTARLRRFLGRQARRGSCSNWYQMVARHKSQGRGDDDTAKILCGNAILA